MVHSKRDEKSWEDISLEPIAIVGMACHLPGQVRSSAALWDLLKKNGSVQTPKVPANRFNIDAHLHPNLERPGSFNVPGGYFLDGALEDFDPTFFNITPVEAMWMDPQQRKILEVAYEALESGGQTLESVAGSNTAVFVGSFTSDYQQMSIRDTDFRHNYAATGVDPGIISNRIGNVFNLRGPSFTINTACSSSVYAIHNACHALRARDCEAALTGGVNLIMTVDQHMNTAKLGILSPTSTCHTFDASADGYGRAEGAGALYLKRLSDAVRDGDPIRGVIRSSAVNTNGKVDGMGITHPSVEGQGRVLRMAYEKAKLDPANTAYAECHGTGTPVGDPIEVRAIASAMNDTRSKDKPLLVGAIKANIGHSEAASGIFAVMKGALMTESGIVPGVAGLKNLNPEILEKQWNVKVNQKTSPWPADFPVRRASVSSFGYGGTNGHVIVESIDSLYPWYQHGKPRAEATYDSSTAKPVLITLSAHDKATLARNIEAHGKVAPDYFLADLAHTLNTRRTQFAQQRAYLVAYEGQVPELFQPSSFTYGGGGAAAGGKKSASPKIGFVFTGQGAQWAGVAVEAMQHFPTFRQTIADLDAVLQRIVEPRPAWTLEQMIMTARQQPERLGEAEIAQPICTAIQIALVAVLEEWGIEPAVSVGHSSGEIGAAYAAGLVSAPEAILAAFYRGLAVKQAAPAGSMMAVGLGADDVAPYLEGVPAEDVIIACENSPSSVTLSGTDEGIDRLRQKLDADGVFARALRTGRAYHSPHMAPVAPVYEHLLLSAMLRLDEDALSWRMAQSHMVSSVTGKEIVPEQVGAPYWSDNLRSRVLFDTAVQAIGSLEHLQDVSVMVEIGPHSALAGPFKQICAAHGLSRFRYVPTLVRNKDSAVQLLKAAGELFLHRVDDLDLGRVNELEALAMPGGSFAHKTRKPLLLVDLPSYQWNYERRFWAEPRFSAEQRHIKYPRHDVLGTRIVGLSESAAAWKNQLRHRDVPWFKDHSLGNAAMFPAAGHLSMAIEALRQINEQAGVETESVTVRNVSLTMALVVPDTDNGIETQFRMNKMADLTTATTTWYAFAVESVTEGIWTTHCTGRIAANFAARPTKLESPVDTAALTTRTPGKRWYDAFERVGFQYAGTFQPLKRVQANGQDRHAAAALDVQTECGVMDGESRYLLHPATVDACLQLIIISINRGLHKEMAWGVVPLELGEVTVWPAAAQPEDVGAEGRAVAWTDGEDGRYFNTHTKLATQSGRVVLDVKNLTCVAYEAAVPPTTEEPRAPEPYMKVEWRDGEKTEETPVEAVGTVAVVSLDQASPAVEGLVETLQGQRVQVAKASMAGCADESQTLPGDSIVVDDVGGQLLQQAALDEAVFAGIKRVVCSGRRVVWVTAGVNEGRSAGGGMAVGFLRAVRSEQAAARLVLLDVDCDTIADTPAVARLATDLLARAQPKDSGADNEFWLSAAGLRVPRIVADDALNTLHAPQQGTTTTTATAADVVLADDQHLAGRFRNGQLVFQALPTAPLPVGHVDVVVDAVDCQPGKISTHFAVGRIARVAPGTDSPLREGQSVVAYTHDTWKTHLTVPVSNVVPLPRDNQLDIHKLLAHLTPLASALQTLSISGRVSAQHRVVLLEPAPAFLRAVAALSTVWGFTLDIIGRQVTTEAREQYPAASFLDLETAKAGEIETLFSSSPSPILAVASDFSALAQQVWTALPSGARFLLNDGQLTQPPDVGPFTRGVALIPTGLDSAHRQKEPVDTILTATLNLLDANPGLANLLDGHHAVDIGSVQAPPNREGTVVLYNYGGSQIKVQPIAASISFCSDAAYVLVGCLGGLGRSLTTFMRERGCANFVFISRSGADKPDAARVVADLEQSGAAVSVYRGDAGNAADVDRILAEVRQSHPIRGVVHAAMVLQDGMLEGLSHERFRRSIEPKVLGAQALHNATGQDHLDFFVMTSSISAVLGNPGQANYSAANSYLDALARQRRREGLPATSLALPMVLDVGVVAENEDLELSLSRKGMYGIDQREMLKSFEVAMLHSGLHGDDSSNGGQLILGLDPALLASAISSATASGGAEDPYWYNDARVAQLRTTVDELLQASASQGDRAGKAAAGGKFISTLSGQEPAAATLAIAQHLMAKCSAILMLSPEDIDLESGSSIASYGLDSMIGAEFRNWLFKEFGFEIGFQTLLTPVMTFKVLAGLIADKLGVSGKAEE
ncbi:hypothetical protein Micbo1qcDRAFT_151968 [Microdochium bolleyi]|uniref:Uncharacterized protein n=1 Tax=Microdochium bolleyi TaxID=196109 RepID=A0A136IQM9_9PEZI|nr:hypothetical protein Micbo1qcDRAFT_151968 [Microdochium bolleyi]